MNRTKVIEIRFFDKMDLARKIAECAPIGYTGFEITRKFDHARLVTYAMSAAEPYLSLDKLRKDLGMEDPKAIIYFRPSVQRTEMWAKIRKGEKSGWVLA